MRSLTTLSPDLVVIADATIFECLIQKIQKQCEIASCYARDYDFDEHSPYNGVRTFLKYIQEYFHAVHALLVVDSEHFIPTSSDMNNNNTSENKSWISNYLGSPEFKRPLDKHIHRMAQIPRDKYESLYLDLHKIGIILLRQLHVMHALHSALNGPADPYSSEITPEKENFVLLQRESWMNEDIKYLLSPEFTLWYLSDTRRAVFSVLRQLMLFASISTTRSLNALVNSNVKRDLLHQIFFKSSSRAMRNLVSSINNSRVLQLCLRGSQYFTNSASLERLQLPRQSKYGFDCDTRDLCKSHAPPMKHQDTTVECLLVYHGSKKSLEKEKNLILHLHGSAFCVTEPMNHSRHLDAWSKNLNTPYLAPKYSKAPEKPFPYAVQDNLDVYLFLTDEQNRQAVKKLLGFVPENIILSGDSAGGNLSLSLLIAICELNRHRSANGETKMIPLPGAVALQYPASSAVIKQSMSRILAVFDGFLAPAKLFFYSSAYLMPECIGDEGEPWFRKPIEQAKSIYFKFLEMNKNPFISPIAYEHLDDLSGIPCYVQGAEFDILLDDAIEIAKRWRGPSILDIVPEANHGFMAGPRTTKIQQHVDEFIDFKRRYLIAK